MEDDDDIFYSPKATKMEHRIHNDDEEKKKLHLIRASLHHRDPSYKDIDEATMRRFLRARDMDVEKASAMLLKCLSWRRSFVPHGSISESEIPNEIAQNKIFLQGTDKQGRPISVFYGSRHYPRKGGLDEFKRFLVFALDKVCQRIPDGVGNFTIISDLKGYGYCNSDLRANLAAITIFQEYYPERLGKMLVVHAPYIFMKMWKIIYPLIDKGMRKRIVFVEDKRLRETLLDNIDEDQLPEIYGGKLQLVPIQNA